MAGRESWDRREQQLWQEEGVIVLPGFLAPPQVDRLRRICDRILAQAIAERDAIANQTNIADLTENHYFPHHLEERRVLLELIASPAILNRLEALAGVPPLFHNTQYFANPRDRSWAGPWHRDIQFVTPDLTQQQRYMDCYTGVHFRVAFVADAQLEIVPGSHRRWDTPAEQAIRLGDDPTAAAMPGAHRIALQPGDGCLFHAWSLHRGTYCHTRPRRTLDIIYGWSGPCPFAQPDPNGLADEALLAALSPGARAFFRRFLQAYSPPRGHRGAPAGN